MIRIKLNNNKDTSRDDTHIWLVFFILLPLIIITTGNPNNDFQTLSAIVQDWLTSKVQLYEAGAVYFAYTPWSLLVYIPLSYLPHPLGQLIFNTISLCLLIWSTWYLSKPISWQLIAISLTTIYTAMLIKQVQWDAFILASLTLGWISIQRKNPWLLGIALVGMTTKYTYIIIPMVILLFAIRGWTLKKIILMAIIPLATLAISFIIAGWDWPIRYTRLLKATLAYYQQIDVTTIFSTTSYPVSYRLILPPLGLVLIIILAIISLYLLFQILRRGVNLDSISLALALNLVISPYFTFHHIIYLAPSHAQLLKKHKIWGFVLVGAAIIDVLLLFLSVGLIIYPIVALVILIITSLGMLYRPELNATLVQ